MDIVKDKIIIGHSINNDFNSIKRGIDFEHDINNIRDIGKVKVLKTGKGTVGLKSMT